MLLLSVQSITKHFGPDPVLDDASFDLHSGQRVGLVGPNGGGKTTLLRIVAGRLDPDLGQVHATATPRLGYLEQRPEFHPGRTLWDEAHDALAHLSRLAQEAEQIAHEIAQAVDESERARLGVRFDRLQHQLQQSDGYQLDHRIERVLEGLGFDRSAFGQPVEQLSGGQQSRLLLAKLLLSEPDVLLLDEPSNHLDIEATQWLEDYLVDTQPTLIVVSHDRYLLDKVTTHTLELCRGRIDSFKGNFSAYWSQKFERLQVQRRSYERQQAEIGKMEEFVRRHHAGQKHAQAEDRRKKLARLQPVEPPREINGPPMGFPRAQRCGDIVLRAERVSKAFEQPLFHDLSFEIARGQRWGIFGANGTGKTTLLRCLLGREPLDQGTVTLGSGVRTGYFDQRLELVDAAVPVVDAIRPPNREFVERQRRDLLARFGLTGDISLKPVGSLSGGERNRVGLARLAAMEPNFLILDEPTNHLDLWARDALEKALLRFDGTVLFVSHDRYFLNHVADHLLVVQDDRFRAIDGNYDFYLHLTKEGLIDGGEKAGSSHHQRASREPASRSQLSTPRPKRRFPYRKVAEIEREILERETALEQLQRQLALPEVLRSGQQVKEVQQRIKEQRGALAALYAHWEEAVELN